MFEEYEQQESKANRNDIVSTAYTELGLAPYSDGRHPNQMVANQQIDSLGFPKLAWTTGDWADEDGGKEAPAPSSDTNAKAKETVNKDGSKILRDASQRILKVTYPDNSEREFERDKNGQLISVKEADGSVWNKQDAKSNIWINDRTQKERKDLSLSYEGQLSYKEADGSSHIVDRTQLHKITNADRSVIEERNGLIEKLKRANGSSVECKYEGGKLVFLKLGTKESYSRPDANSTEWTHSKEGKSYTSKGAEIKPDASIILNRGDIEASETVYIKGNGKLEYKNGASVDFNPEGKALLVMRPNGTRSEFSYRSGQISKLDESYLDNKSAAWTKEQGKWWSMQDIGRSYNSISVSRDGVVSYDNGKFKVAKNVDGTQTSKNKEGASWTFDQKKRLTNYTRPDGTSLHYEHKDTSSDPKDKGQLVRVREQGKKEVSHWEKTAEGHFVSPDKPGEMRQKLSIDRKGEYGYIAFQGNEIKEVRYPQGSARQFEHKEGELTKITQDHGKDGKIVWQRQEGTDSWSDGKVQEERKQVKISPQGVLSYLDENGLKLKYTLKDREHRELAEPHPVNEKIEEAKNKLVSLTDSLISEAKERESFRKDTERFQNKSALKNLEPEKVEKTLAEISEMIANDSADAPFSKVQRLELAKELMHHLAYPREIDQGWHNTCNVATIQVVTAVQHPENFAGLLREVTTTGQYTTKQNLVVKPDPQSLKPDFEAKEYKPYDPEHNDHNRSQASQIFQVTAINSYYVQAKSQLRYFQKDSEHPRDNGERLLNSQTKSVAGKEPKLTADNMVEIGKQINGSPSIIIASPAVGNRKTVDVRSERELREKVLEYKKNNQLPVIVEVFTDHEPYRSESGPGGCHVVTLWDMDKSGKMLMDNQWGKDADHEGLRRLSASQVYKALQP